MGHRFFNKALRVLLVTNSLILLAGAMFGPIYALFVAEIGGDLFEASLAGGIFALAAGVTTLFAGKLADRVKETELIVVFGYTLMGLGFLLYVIVNSLWFLFFIQALLGFAEAVYSPSFDALYAKHVSPRQAGREWGAWESINYFSAAFGAIAGGFVVSQFSFTSLFIIMAALCLLSAAYIYQLPRRIL